jgi:hypothetical protein
MAGQLLFAPLALLTALFRPLFFEARNPPMAISAVETTMLVMFIARSAFQKGVARLWRDTRRSPALMLALTFVLTFAVAVGLSSTNLGTLSRYRVPMLPFLVELVVCWHFRSSIHREPARPPVSRSIRPRRRALPATT